MDKTKGNLLARIVEDAALRRELDENPQEAMKKLGIELTPEQLAEVSGAGEEVIYAPPYVPIGPSIQQPGLPLADLFAPPYVPFGGTPGNPRDK